MNNFFALKFVQKPVVRNSAFGLLSFFASLFLTLVVTPVLIYQLGIEQFGLWSVCSAMLGLLGVFNFGLGDTIIKYVAEYWSKRDIDGTAGIISAALVMNLSLALLVSLLLFLVSPFLAKLFLTDTVTNAQVQPVIRIAIWGFAPMTIRNAMLAVSKGFQDYKVVTLFDVGVNIFSNGLAVLIAVLVGNVYGMIVSSVVVLWISCILGILIVSKKIRLMSIPVNYFKVKTRYIKEIFQFSFFVGLTNVGSMVFNFADRLTVGAVLGLTAASYYTIAIGIASKFLVIASSITQSLMPAFSAWKQELSLPAIAAKLTRAIVIIAVPILASAGLLLLFSRPLLIFWLGEGVGLAVLPVLRILIIIYASVSCVSPAYQVANGLGYPWINTVSSLLMSFFTILLIIVLGGRYGLIGAALANGAMGILFLIPPLMYYKLRSY